MKALLEELQSVVEEARQKGIPIAVIGACGLRTYLPSPDKRVSVDADVLTTSTGVDALEALLESRGYRTFTTGPWRRAERSAPERLVIDIAVDAIVDVRTFRSYAIDWSTVTARSEPGRAPIPVPRLEDLLVQKLISAREKDLLDVILVASDESIAVRVDVIARQIEAQDVEIPVTRGCLEAEAAVASGRMAELWAERYGEEVSAESLEKAVRRVREWIENGQ
jgi:hypothetical protein